MKINISTRACVLLLSLGLSACQAPTNTPLPDTQTPAQSQSSSATPHSETPAEEAPKLLNESEFAQAFSKIFDTYSRKNVEGQSTASQTLSDSGSLAEIMQLAVPEANSTSPEATAAPSAMATAAPMDEPSPDIALPPEALDSLVNLLKAQVEAVKALQEQLGQLTPLPTIQGKYDLLQEYFSLSQELSEALLAEIEKSGPEILQSPGLPPEFEAKYSTQLARSKEITPEALEILTGFMLEPFRQERQQLQTGAVLSQESYLSKIKALFPSIERFSPLSEFFNSDANSNPAQEQLDALAQLKPPSKYEEAQTTLYAVAKLQNELAQRLKQLQPELGDPKEEPVAFGLALQNKLSSDPDLLMLSLKLGLFLPRIPEISKELHVYET